MTACLTSRQRPRRILRGLFLAMPLVQACAPYSKVDCDRRPEDPRCVSEHRGRVYRQRAPAPEEMEHRVPDPEELEHKDESEEPVPAP